MVRGVAWFLSRARDAATGAGGAGLNRKRGVRGRAVEAVVGAGPDVEFGGDAGLQQAGRVGDDLVAEGFGGADVQEGRREARKVFRAGRGGVGRDVRAAARLPEQRRAASVAAQQGHRGRETAARAGAADDRARRVDAEVPGVRECPLQTGITVLDRRRVRVFRGHAVVDRHEREAELQCVVLEHQQVPAAVAAEDHAAAVHPVQHWHVAGDPGRPADDQRNAVGVHFGQFDGGVGGDLVERELPGGPLFTQRRDRRRGVERRALGAHPLQHHFQLGVERQRRPHLRTGRGHLGTSQDVVALPIILAEARPAAHH